MVKIKRVVAYCRVSTDKADQLSSLENQKKFFNYYINHNEGWQLVQIYVDEGLSGTSTNKRKAFNQMIADAEAKKFDLVLTKEISRFARNTLDSIYYTRLLKSRNIGVYFINDNINTLEPDSELRLTIMASIAQEESRKTSDRVKWGQRRSMEKGVAFGNRVYGYHLINGQLSINEEEAEVVRLVYSKYLNDGKGVNLIAKELDTYGIPTPTRIQHWTHATLLRILRNEKYIGMLKQKKQITTDYLKHSRKRNEGEEEFIIIENNHPAIITKEVFYKAQDEIKQRNNHRCDKTKYSNRYCFSGKLICGHCGTRFKRKIANTKAKNSQVLWQCGMYEQHGREKINEVGQKTGCNNKSINEKTIEKAFLSVLDDIITEKQIVIESIESSLKKVLKKNDEHFKESEQLQMLVERIQARKKKLVDIYMDNMISKQEFDNMSHELHMQIETHKKEIERISVISTRQQNFDNLVYIIRSNIVNIINLKEFSEEVCKTVLDSVTVYGRDNMEFSINGFSGKRNCNISFSETQYRRLKEQ